MMSYVTVGADDMDLAERFYINWLQTAAQTR